jgi:hypothetical protein
MPTTGYRKCPICEESKRTDTMKSHIYCQHGKRDVHKWLEKEVLEEALVKKIPMMWRIAQDPKKEYDDIDSRLKNRDYCICLVCKELRYYKPDCHINSDVKGFFDNHTKTDCMARWNSVARLFSQCADLVSEEYLLVKILLDQSRTEVIKLKNQLKASQAETLDYKGRWECVLERMRTG